MHLTVIPTYEPGKVSFSYTIPNDSETEIYVDQFMPSHVAPMRNCYVYAHADGQLLLYFGTVPNPPLVFFAQEINLYKERLMPGQALRASLTLSVPVLEESKVDDADAAAPHEVVLLSRVKLVVNYYRPGRGVKIKEIPGLNLYELRYGTPTSLSAELSIPNPLQAQRRTGNFHRPFESPLRPRP